MEAFETKSRLLYQAMNGAYHPRESELAGLQSGSLRKHPFLLALRRWGRFAQRTSPAGKSEEERMFSQANSRCEALS